MFSTLSYREIIILATFKLWSANAFKSGWYKILSFGKRVKVFFRQTEKQTDSCQNFICQQSIHIEGIKKGAKKKKTRGP